MQKKRQKNRNFTIDCALRRLFFGAGGPSFRENSKRKKEKEGKREEKGEGEEKEGSYGPLA